MMRKMQNTDGTNWNKGPSGNSLPQVLFVFPSEKGGRGFRPAGNTKPEEKLEENRGGGKVNLRKTSF